MCLRKPYLINIRTINTLNNAFTFSILFIIIIIIIIII
jgi:hypothetical protein